MYHILSHEGNDEAVNLSNRYLFTSTTPTAILCALLFSESIAAVAYQQDSLLSVVIFNRDRRKARTD